MISTYSQHSTEELLNWIKDFKEIFSVDLRLISLDDCSPWYYDEAKGEIRNEKGTFFQITGLKAVQPDGAVFEQPIIIQDEIGFLGIICCRINNVWHYLMQAKIEPGNVNAVQISPTIQATKSNFTQRHGGAKPAFLDYFLDMNSSDVLVDQIQSEQSSRFLGKRNRNVILVVRKRIEETATHRWMTLSQIKEFMRYDNLVNMDTRTVLSCIPYVLLSENESDIPFENRDLFSRSAKSMDHQIIVDLYSRINDYKMFNKPSLFKVPLYSLRNWEMDGDRFRNMDGYPFELVFCKISIEGREVTNWSQPLFAATGTAIFGLFCCIDNGVYKFLVKVKPEIGCFDGAEIGPTIQDEANCIADSDCVSQLFYRKLDANSGVMCDVLLSEEGGRFYQEQNRNVIIRIDRSELGMLPRDYVWSDYGTLNILTQVNNCLNIQLRNLLSLLEI